VELQTAVGIIARGMRDNPLHIAALGGDPDARSRRLMRMFTVALPAIFDRGSVLGAFHDDTMAGIAGMVSPGLCQPTMKEKLALLPRILPAVGSGGFGRIARWMAAWSEHDLQESHWHLGPVAIDAHLQRRGIGSRLLEEYCARIDRDYGVGYLETDKAVNVTFYERFGFVTIASASVLNVPNWFMRRAAKGVAD
jgi:hypothetical protein